MGETRTVHDPFIGKDVQVSNKFTDRLRGKYASGPTMASGEPEFGWRQFETPPIQHEAADMIDALVKVLDEILSAEKDFREGMPADWEGDPLTDACKLAREVRAKVGT